MTTRDARTAAVLEQSKDLQRKLREMAAELDRYVHELHLELDRLHDKERTDE